nr:MAG TPA: hypothetical protein [Caudoviricetes sp.]
MLYSSSCSIYPFRAIPINWFVYSSIKILKSFIYNISRSFLSSAHFRYIHISRNYRFTFYIFYRYTS